MENTHAHDLTDELIYIVGGRGKLERFGKCPTLCRLAKADGVPEERGWVVRKFLEVEIGFAEGPIRFKGREYSAEIAQRAWVTNLDLEGTGFGSPHRRELVLDLLGLWKWSWGDVA
jgi:hypothetical protein